MVVGIVGIQTSNPYTASRSTWCYVRSPEFCSCTFFFGKHLFFPPGELLFILQNLLRCQSSFLWKLLWLQNSVSILLLCFTYTSIIAQFSVCCWICSQFCPARFPETLSRLYPSKHLLSKQTKTYSRLKNWGSSHQMALNNFVKRESRSSVETEGQRDEWAVRLKKGRNILVQIPWGVWHGAHICHQNYYSLHMYNIFQF